MHRVHTFMQCLLRAMPMLLLLLASCDSSDSVDSGAASAGHIIVVAVDRSGSTNKDRGVYDGALGVVTSALRAGDRFVLAPISATSGQDFRAAVDIELPEDVTPASWIESRFDYDARLEIFEDATKQATERIEKETAAFMDVPANANQTGIFECLRTVAPLFSGDPRKGVLVILSDMLEVSPHYNFEKMKIDEKFIQAELERQQNAGIIPKLPGVNIWVAGVTVSPPERAAAIKRLWKAYFDTAGARVRHWGRVLFRFEV